MVLTKADTLDYLKNRITKSRIEDLMIVTGKMYEENREQVLADIQSQFKGQTIVVRSSCSNEDSSETSNAGHYDSILDVDADDCDAVCRAVETVFDSYKKDLTDIRDEQILIQTQTKSIISSGVIFSREIKAGRLYYAISYDEDSTDAVTSGSGGQTIYIARTAESSSLPERWGVLITAMRELEDIFPEYPLDVEFAVGADLTVTIFQVRPLAACIKKLEKPSDYKEDRAKNDRIFGELINKTKQQYQKLSDLLYEKQAILSDMAFWNPAEIIGVNPHPLDFSLYREIITKAAWNQGLTTIGYRVVDGDLMYKIGNKPYISLRKSFLCLMPADLDADMVKKLLAFYDRKILSDITAHDKIEFEVVFSNYDFTTEDRLQELLEYGFTKGEIQDLSNSLFHLTDRAICNFRQNRMQDIRSLNGLKVHRENIRNNWLMAAKDVNTSIRYFIELIESIKQYGTPKFARQARLAFISKALCRSLSAKGYFTNREIDDFMMSIYTVASEYDSDFQDFAVGRITRAAFDEKYGHLRSGTYDITCETYAEQDFDSSKASETAKKQRQRIERLKHTPLDPEKVDQALSDIGFGVDAKKFVEFLKDSMEEREYFKFEFTKSLSLAIDILINIGEMLNFSKEDMAYLTVDDIIAVYHKPETEIRRIWEQVIAENRKVYTDASDLILSDVICNQQQLEYIEMVEARPNFITSEIVTGAVVVLEDEESKRDDAGAVDVADKIVVIPKADPGYDWIFAKGIRGFITKYGGVASHMAIRCAEFNIPAAIGCGDVIYNYVTGLDKLTLDCKNGKILKEE